MRDRMQDFSEADQMRLTAIAQALAEFGLGIAAPHKHLPDGTIAPLPPGEISLERDLKVGFVGRAAVSGDVEAVGWRYFDGELVAFAGCCGNQPDIRAEEAAAS